LDALSRGGLADDGGSGVDTKPLNLREVSTVARKRKRRNVLGKDFNMPPTLNNMAWIKA
jgi:hypothetical protein